MKHLLRLSIIVVSIALSTQQVFARKLYKSIDPNGQTVYGDHVPSKGTIENALKLKKNSATPTEPVAQPAAQAIDNVVIYTASWCGYCKKARVYLESRNISYHNVDIETPDGEEAFVRVSNGKNIPLLLVGTERIQGFSESSYNEVFANKN